MSNAEKIKLVVYINFVLLTCALVYVIYTTVQFHRALPSATDPKYPEEYRRVKHRIVVVSISWTFAVLTIALFNTVLLRGVTQRSYKKCMIWFVYSCFGTTVQIYKIVMSFVFQEYVEGTYLLIWASFSLYALYIVKSFMTEVRSDSSLQPLTNKD